MNRTEFKEKAKENIDDLFQQLDQMEQKALEVKGDAKEKLQEKIALLQERKKDLHDRFKNLEKSTDENWTKVVNAFTNGVDAFKETLQQ
ncbi:MAG: hypothetical protein H6563_07585 [Lewinellaceae bacterium]|nr:hypothetical protein [Lewinellaceae bacterium]